MKKTMLCRSCGAETESVRLDLGRLPVCNRFTAERVEPATYPLELGVCGQCALVQLFDIAPIDAIRPRLPWIRYNEPSAHLDDAAAQLAALVGNTGAALGVGPFDGPLLERLKLSGCEISSIDGRELAGEALNQPYAYLETYQAGLLPVPLAGVAGGRDLVICRYLVEHSHDPVLALRGLGSLLGPKGVLVVEVPDSRKFIQRRDYCFPWEEHVCYFTEETIRGLAVQAGFVVERLLRYPGLLEDALIVALRPAPRLNETAPNKDYVAEQMREFETYAAAFPGSRDRWRSKLEQVTAQGDNVALMGIGHQAITVVNAFGLQDLIAFAVDDDRDKLGLFAPGFRSPVIASSELATLQATLCLMAVNPRVIPKIQEKLGESFSERTEFVSIFAGLGPETAIGKAP